MSEWINGHYHGESCPPPRYPEDGRTYKCNGTSWLPVIEGHTHKNDCGTIFHENGAATWSCDLYEGFTNVVCGNPNCSLEYAHEGFCEPVAHSSSNPNEVRTTSATGGEKGMKNERFDLIPVGAMSVVAELYGKGAKKYSAHNWRKGYEWSKSYAALQRHANAFWDGEDIDPDPQTQLPHMAAVVFHALTLLTFMTEQPGFDDRFKKPESDALYEGAIVALRRFAETGEENAENN